MVHLHNRNSNIGTYIWISSQKNDLDAHMKELKNWFSQRGYPAKAISEQVNRTLTLEENVKEKDGQHMKENDLPLLVTYNSNFNNLSFLIRKNLQFLYADNFFPSEVLGT